MDKPLPDGEETTLRETLFSPIMILGVTLLLVLLFTFLGSGINYMLADRWQLDFMALAEGDLDLENRVQRQRVRTLATINQLFTFLLPSLMAAAFIFRERSLQGLELHRRPALQPALRGMLLLLSSLPLIFALFVWNKSLPLPEWMIEQEQSIGGMIEGLMVTETNGEIVFNLLLIGVLPALGEEMLFRGFLQKQLGRWFKNGHLAVWITAILFSAIHFQFQGFFPRLVLGALLGYLFFWTRNLWIPILAHFAVNTFQLAGRIMGQDVLANTETVPETTPDIPWWSIALSVLIVGLISHTFIRASKPQI